MNILIMYYLYFGKRRKLHNETLSLWLKSSYLITHSKIEMCCNVSRQYSCVVIGVLALIVASLDLGYRTHLLGKIVPYYAFIY